MACKLHNLTNRRMMAIYQFHQGWTIPAQRRGAVESNYAESVGNMTLKANILRSRSTKANPTNSRR